MFDLHGIEQGLGAFFSGTSWLSPLKILLGAFVFGQVVAWTYEVTYRGLSYSRGFGQTLVLVAIGAAILVLAMSHSLVAGLGIFGVLSMIRFRATLKAPRDLAFVLGSATIGTACGVSAMLPAFMGTVVFCAVALYLHRGTFGSRARYDGVLRFRLDSQAELPVGVESILRRFCRRHTLLGISEIAQGSRVEHTYQIKLWRDGQADALLTALRDDLKAADARLLMQEATLEY